MKKFVMVCLAVWILTSAQAQDSKEVIKKFDEYSSLLLKKDFDKALNYVHTGIYDILPREQMKAVLEQTFSNPMMDIEMTMPEVKGISTTKLINKVHYVKFNSKSIVKMRFNMEGSGGDPEAIQNQIKQGLITQFGEQNVSYDKASGFFTVATVKPVIAASPDKKDWKFVTIDSEQLVPMLEKFIPKEILDLKVE
ncbi:MAG: hypothetical protein J0L66_01825 [Cytophagales bacterium]|nr:hypothetical protein [Cytophagales bacterium]